MPIAPHRTALDMAIPHVLLVEPSAPALARLSQAIGSLAYIDACSSFKIARDRLRHRPYDRLITNLRLGSFNGLHLVYVGQPTMRCVVYADRRELVLGAEIEAAGAFSDWYERLLASIGSY